MKQLITTALLGLSLAGCSVLPAGAERQASRADTRPAATTPSRSNAAPSVAARPADNQCLRKLGDAGAQFTPLPDRYLDQGCTNLGTVQMYALAGDNGRLDVSNLGPVTCPVSTAFAAWARFGVDRAARAVFGTPLASIQTMGSYSCRNVAGSSRRSGHASAAAIDVGGFTLADGRRISVQNGWDGDARERQFLRLVQQSACRRFGTVLGPDYNAAHRDHLHVEGVIEGSSYCR